MKTHIKAGIIVPIVCAVGTTLAGVAALSFGAAATPPEPIPLKNAKSPCDVHPDAKDNRCPPAP